jgi:hypothetical protein
MITTADCRRDSRMQAVCKAEATGIRCIASPIVYQILLVKSCVLSSYKKVCQVKKVYLQQFGIIHLSNLDLTYIRNPEINKIMFMFFHLLETYIRNPSLFFISFFTLPPRAKCRWQPRSARVYMRVINDSE